MRAGEFLASSITICTRFLMVSKGPNRKQYVADALTGVRTRRAETLLGFWHIEANDVIYKLAYMAQNGLNSLEMLAGFPSAVS